MKTTKIITAALLLAGLALPSYAQVSSGNLVIGFEAATGSTGATTNLEVDLGGASLFSSAASGTYTIGNLSADLTSIYGANWNTRADLAFGIIGGGSSTLYASSSHDSTQSPIPAWTQKSAGFYTTPNSKIASLYGPGIQGSFGNALDATSLADINSQVSSLGSYHLQGISTLAADPGSYSGTKGSASPFAMSWASTTGVVFTTTPSGATGGTGVADLYKMIGGSGNGTLLGTFSLDSAGILSFTTPIPEPSTYAMILGVAALGFVMLRRRQQSLA
jgi:hypothetical protein